MTTSEVPQAAPPLAAEQDQPGFLHRYRTAIALAASSVLLSTCAAPEATMHEATHGQHAVDAQPGAYEGNSGAKAEVDKAHPNVVFILLDDMQMELLPHMKSVNTLLKDRGMYFDNYYDNMTLCCPARASILRGQYAHNTGVKSNTTPNGGFEKFHTNGDEKSTIATWINHLKNKDGNTLYDTALIGKYLNNFPYNYAPGKHHIRYASNHFVPPGWTTFDTAVVGDPYLGTHYKFARNGVVDKHFHNISKNPKNYMNDYMGQMADALIQKDAAANKPSFLYWAPWSPHVPSTVAPRFRHFPVSGPRPTDNPAYNEQNMSDKPKFMHSLQSFSSKTDKEINHAWVKRVRAVQALDEAVASMVAQMKADGTYDNTYIIFTSDNGFHQGQHRMPGGKNTPYNTDIHLPLIIEGPGIQPGSVSNEAVSDIDLAPTIAQLTGAHVPYHTDGRSLVPLLMGKHPSNWRKFDETERFNSQNYSSTFDGINEPADTPAEVGTTSTIPYRGIRNGHWLYVVYRYKPGQDNSGKPTEFYDEHKDPYELHNLASEKNLSPYYQKVQLRLQRNLGKLANCQGVVCSTN